jgi:hypothetical protein
VLDAVACEDLDRAIIHHDGHGNRQLALGLAQDGVEAGVQVDQSGDLVKLREHRAPQVMRWRLGHHEPGLGVDQCLLYLNLHNQLLVDGGGGQ